jgi:FixJ family two-component response regulator
MGRPVSAGVVYVVDADVAVRQALARFIGAAGLSVHACESVQAFLDQHSGDGNECLVLDVDAATCPAGELRARLRSEAAGVPIIAMSADDDRPTRRTARDLGAQAFFRKPVDGPALVDSIAWAIDPDAEPPAR